MVEGSPICTPEKIEAKKQALRSQRLLNQAKAVAIVIGALSGVVGVVLSTRNTVSPSEPVAEQGYQVTRSTVDKLSEDIQREHDERLAQLSALQKDVQATRDELRMLLLILSAQERRQATATVSPVPARPPGTRPQAADQDTRRLVDKAIAELKMRQEQHDAAQQQLKSKPRPPRRGMPDLAKLRGGSAP